VSGVCIITKDLPRLSASCCEALQAQPEGDDRFTRIACDGPALSLFALDGMEAMVPGSMDGAGTGCYTLEVEVDDPDAHFARLSSLGYRALKPPTTQPWGRRSTWFRDPDNNIVNFYSNLGARA